MNILQDYTKSHSQALHSITIKLPQEMITALRYFNVSLGAVVRDLLKDSDLMHQYKDLGSNDESLANEESYFAFEYESVKYYKNIDAYWTLDNNVTKETITKHPFYRIKKLVQEDAK